MLYERGNVKYDMKIDKTKKTFSLYGEGFLSNEDGDAYINDFERLTKTFNVNEYSLVLDSKNLKPSTPEIAKGMEILFAKYLEVPFKKIYLLTEGNPITISQIKRVGKRVPKWEESVEYVDSIEDVK